MSETARCIATTPADNTPAPSPSVPPATPARHRAARLLLAPFLFLWRRPGRALAVLALCAIIGLAVGVAGVWLWFDHHLGAARRAVERGHNAEAVSHLKTCTRVYPDHPEVLLLSARVARRTGAWTEAEARLDRYWKRHGDDDALVLERLLLRATTGEVEAVRPLLQAAIDREDPSAPLAREALIAGLLYRYRLDDAARQLDRWQEHDPDSTMALLLRGKLQEQREQAFAAVNTYRRLLDLDPEHDEARMRLATALLLLNHGEEALSHLEYLRSCLPENPEVLVGLAQALDLQGRAGEARAALDECLRDNPHHAAALAERGRLLLRDGDSERAEEDLHLAVRLDPGNYSARYQYQLALDKNGKKAEAAQEEAAITRIKADVERINELINGRLQEAPHDASAHYEVAMIALRAGRPKEALRWLLNALRVDPNHLPTHRALAVYYRETGNPVLAGRHRALAQNLERQRQP